MLLVCTSYARQPALSCCPYPRIAVNCFLFVTQGPLPLLSPPFPPQAMAPSSPEVGSSTAHAAHHPSPLGDDADSERAAKRMRKSDGAPAVCYIAITQ